MSNCTGVYAVPVTTTVDLAPDPPSNVRVHNLTSRSVTLTWDKSPAKQQYATIAYSVHYRVTGGTLRCSLHVHQADYTASAACVSFHHNVTLNNLAFYVEFLYAIRLACHNICLATDARERTHSIVSCIVSSKQRHN